MVDNLNHQLMTVLAKEFNLPDWVECEPLCLTNLPSYNCLRIGPPQRKYPVVMIEPDNGCIRCIVKYMINKKHLKIESVCFNLDDPKSLTTINNWAIRQLNLHQFDTYERIEEYACPKNSI